MSKLNLNSFRKFFATFDDVVTPPAGDPPVTPPAGDPPVTPPAGDPQKDDIGKVFTQEEVNRFLAEEKRKSNTQTQTQVKELKALQEKAKLTEEERTNLSARIETMENSMLTKDELHKKQTKKEKDKYEQELSDWKGKYEILDGRYKNETIDRALLDAATAGEVDAFSPKDISLLLRPTTRLVEVLDEDEQATGRFETKIKFNDTNETGETIQLDLTPSQAVKRMSEMDQFAYMFKSSATGGFGGGNSGKGKPSDLKNMKTAAYIEGRRKGTIKHN